MRGSAAPATAAPRGERMLALRARAILVEGDPYDLFAEIWLAKREMQRIIDALWELDRLPRRALAVDLNLRQLTLYDGRRVRRIETRYPEALKLKHLAERVQRGHPYSWRRNGRLLKLVGSLHRRSARIVLDWTGKTAKYLVLKARRMRAAIAVEDLERMWRRASQESSTLADRLSRFAYRKLLQALEAKAVEHGVPIAYVDPRGTSKTCPRCGAPLHYTRRLAVCPRCGFVADRDTVGAMNIHRRALTALAPRPRGRGAPPR